MVTNTGGRVFYTKDSEVRIILIDGKISDEIYRIDSERSDRRGHVLLVGKTSKKQIKVNFRRIIPIDTSGMSVVLEAGGKYRAVCPKCSFVAIVGGQHDSIECPTHGNFKLHWIGPKPMSEKTQTPKKEKEIKSRQTVDLTELSKIEGCELWTKKGDSFDKNTIAVESHVLISTKPTPRKLCFNTYNGHLGKNQNDLPIESFLNGEETNPKSYDVSDLQKEHAKLIKKGYIRN